MIFILSTGSGSSATFTYDLAGNLLVATQTVASIPSIVTQPANQVASENENVYFSVEASGGGLLSYQWLSNGMAITGATNDVLTLPAVVIPTNLVSDGGFENPSIAVSYQAYAGGAVIGAWSVETGSVYLVRSSYWQASDGVQSLDLNATIPGSIYQDLATSPGQSYILHFALSGSPNCAPTIKTNQVWWGSNLLDTISFNTTGHSFTTMGWTNLEYTVTATNSTTRLRFVSLTAGGCGPALDAVSVIAVQPPPVGYSVIVSDSSGSVTSVVASAQMDLDGNGLPDAWERSYFGATGQDPNADPDGDGVSNLNEYLEGTDPTNPASFRARLYLTVTPGGQALVSPLAPSYALGTVVQLTATADPGNLLSYWSGSITNTNPVVNLVMDGHKSITALFSTELINGGNATGQLLTNGPNMYGFNANAGAGVLLRIGTTNFSPELQLYGPAGVLVASAGVVGHDAGIAYQTTNSGTFTVVVKSFYAGGSGTYALHYLKFPGNVVIPPGDDGGPMVNGGDHIGSITLGDIDPWSFSANAGDNFTVRIGTTNFGPSLKLYGPTGAVLASVGVAGPGRDTGIAYQATDSGIFTVVVQDFYTDEQGTYNLHLAQVPEPFVVPAGESGGPMTNGANHLGTIELGDIDLWSFPANAGDNFTLRIGSTNFGPSLKLFGPNGALLASAGVTGPGRDTGIAYQATNSGTFTVLVQDFYVNETGTYNLHLAQTPEAFVVPGGEFGGSLTNGANHLGSIDLGDVELWNFPANAGDNFTLRIGTTNFGPSLKLFGPNGALLASVGVSGPGRDTAIAYQATNSGTFTVLVQDFYTGERGTYSLHLAQVPEPFTVPAGDEGGTLVNGGNHAGVIDLGDLDLWSLTADRGDSIVLRIGATNFAPSMKLFGPSGVLLASPNLAGPARDNLINYQPTNSGTFTVLIQDFYTGEQGAYNLRFMKIPGAYIVPPGDEGGLMSGGRVYNGFNDLGDLDIWSFTAFKGAPISLHCQSLSAGYDPEINLYGPSGVLLASAFSATAAVINYVPTNNGIFTVLVSSYLGGGFGNYQLSGTNVSSGLLLSTSAITSTNFVIVGTGGASNVQYVVSTTTNLLTPPSLWTPILTNRFDALGGFSLTNVFVPANPAQFFRLIVP